MIFRTFCEEQALQSCMLVVPSNSLLCLLSFMSQRKIQVEMSRRQTFQSGEKVEKVEIAM